jgi:hypothetical protein
VSKLSSKRPAELKGVTWNIEYGAKFGRILETIRMLDADV